VLREARVHWDKVEGSKANRELNVTTRTLWGVQGRYPPLKCEREDVRAVQVDKGMSEMSFCNAASRQTRYREAMYKTPRDWVIVKR